MQLLKNIKKRWETLWLPRLQEGKTKVELDRDKKYETNWVWYHTILAVELLAVIILLFWIAIVLTMGYIRLG
jgi:hypothetical protein|tara:strand:+ start:151 stop:366 length:216 start_codon:yes stop_codon:yes gene_type:complete